MKKYKNIVKLSNLLLDAILELKPQKLRKIQGIFKDFNSKCSDAVRDSNQFCVAVGKNWFESAEKIRTRVNRNLDDFLFYLQRFKENMSVDQAKLPKLSDILAELSQIDQELGEYRYDLKERTISVITESITLDDIPLGSFEIRLLIDKIGGLYTGAPYRVIALEPNPAGSDDNVTHPHVSSDRLCEGDGRVPIRKALEQGRLCDFFTMIVGILQTYNPDSPYVSLDEWQGTSCYDCGSTVGGDDCYYCECCENEYCAYCSTYCQICDTTTCLGCACECSACNEQVCQSCASKCKECEEVFCKRCLTEEGLCNDCDEQRKETENEEQDQKSIKQETCAAVQPDGMGQIIVHA